MYIFSLKNITIIYKNNIVILHLNHLGGSISNTDDGARSQKREKKQNRLLFLKISKISMMEMHTKIFFP